MNRLIFALLVCVLLSVGIFDQGSQLSQPANDISADFLNAEGDEVADIDYFAELKVLLKHKWPKNQRIHIVFHGHSVPAGYFKTPEVRTFDAYPTLFHQLLANKFSTAVIDVSVTAIGGENSVSGAGRFADDVLLHKPDLVFIDYCLNDRRIGLKKAEAAWRSMIEACVERNTLVVLLTPTPDSGEKVLNDESPLGQHATQIRNLAAEYKIPVVDSYAAFKSQVEQGADVNEFLSQSNHPNRAGHEVVAKLIFNLFE